MSIRQWDANEDDLISLTLAIEGVGNLIARIENENYYNKTCEILEQVESAKEYKNKVAIAKRLIKMHGLNDLIICDRNGMCIHGIIAHPLDMVGDNKSLHMVRIETVITSLSK